MNLSLSKMILVVMALNELCIEVDGKSGKQIKKIIKKETASLRGSVKTLEKEGEHHEEEFVNIFADVTELKAEGELHESEYQQLLARITVLEGGD